MIYKENIQAEPLENVSLDMCAQRGFNSACAFAQFDLNLLCAHLRLQRMQSSFVQITRTLIRPRGCAGWFESSLGAGHSGLLLFAYTFQATFLLPFVYPWRGLIVLFLRQNITKTYLYNFDPLKPHFYIVKLGFTGVYIIFLIFAWKHRLWVLVRTASSRRF